MTIEPRGRGAKGLSGLSTKKKNFLFVCGFPKCVRIFIIQILIFYCDIKNAFPSKTALKNDMYTLNIRFKFYSFVIIIVYYHRNSKFHNKNPYLLLIIFVLRCRVRPWMLCLRYPRRHYCNIEWLSVKHPVPAGAFSYTVAQYGGNMYIRERRFCLKILFRWAFDSPGPGDFKTIFPRLFLE